MRDGWEQVTLGGVTRKRADFTPVEPDGEYTILGVQRSGWGFVERDPIRGDEQKFTKLMRIEQDDLVYRTITAFEAPSAVAGPEQAGRYVTPQTFPVFKIDRSRLLPGFMALLTTWPAFHEEMSSRCTGSVLRRKILSVGAFQSIPVMLPPLVEQQRIVDLIAALDDTITAIDTYANDLRRLLAARRDLIFGISATVPAPELFDIRQGLQRSPARAAGPHQVQYLRSANVLNGRLDLSDVKTMSFDLAQQDRYRLAPGDVLVSEGSASAEAVGAPSEYQGELEGTVCFQNTLLRYRAIPGRSMPGFVSQWCSWAYESGAFREAASGTNIKHIGSGGASRMRVADIPFEDQPKIIADLEAAQLATEAALAQSRDLRRLRSNLLTALLSGEHEIPASYDDLIDNHREAA